MLPNDLRDTFDAILEAQIEVLPAEAIEIVEASPIIVEDEPPQDVLDAMGMTAEEGRDLCGMHFGVAETDRCIEDTYELPTQIMLFRGPIIRLANYQSAGAYEENRDELINQIRITLLHEIGHQFGLDEDDLADLGYD